jgi:hypothetical protein
MIIDFEKSADIDMTLEEFMDQIRHIDQEFPEKAIKWAIRYPETVTPALLNILNATLENYACLEKNNFMHVPALFLLAQFRETKAFPLIMQIASLPGDWPDKILDNAITESLHKIIASVYNNDLAAIQQIIENPNLCIWSRDAAIRSLLVLVKEKTLERESVIQYFQTLFNLEAFTHHLNAMTSLVNAAHDLYPAELYDSIKFAFKNNQVDKSWKNLQEINSTLSLPKNNALKKYLFNNMDYTLIINAIEEIAEELDWRKFFQNDSEDDEEIFDSLDFDYPQDIPYMREMAKIGRNDPCFCGSGKKYKKCCLE